VLVGAQGCFTGHLVDTARRWEEPVAYEGAVVAGDRVVVAYTAVVSDENGRRLARGGRRAALALADLARREPSPAAYSVVRLADDAPLDGRPIGVADASPLGDVQLLSAVLTRTWTEPWVYPLVPFTLVADAVADPVLFFFAPAVIVPGD
jgi:hypothetical protein